MELVQIPEFPFLNTLGLFYYPPSMGRKPQNLLTLYSLGKASNEAGSLCLANCVQMFNPLFYPKGIFVLDFSLLGCSLGGLFLGVLFALLSCRRWVFATGVHWSGVILGQRQVLNSAQRELGVSHYPVWVL